MAYIGNSPSQGSITGGNIVDGSIESIDLATLTNIDINSGSIDGTIIGASSAAAGSFTTLNTTGNVGIGTSSPTYKLTVSGTDAAIQILDTGTDTGSSNIYFGDANTATRGQINYVHSDESLRIISNAAERMRISSSGNVGIGTSTLTSNVSIKELHVDSPITNGVSRLRLSSSVENMEALITLNGYLGADALTFGIGSAGDGSATERMRISSSGQLLIGTTDSSEEGAFVATNSGGETAFSFRNNATATNTASSIFLQTWTSDGTQAGASKISSIKDGTAFGSTLAFYTTTGVAGNTTERMRIDSSGNLLVGTTTVNASGSNVAGVTAQADGRLDVSSTVEPLDVNRISTDGTIVNLRKDGTAVGSIGVNSSNLYFSKPGQAGIRLGALAVNPCDSSGGALDNFASLGSSGERWKDLYLSGGVYLGGTGVANHLDDYETGTFTPSLSFGGGSTGLTTTVLAGQYTKVGRLVYIRINVRFSAKGSSTGSFLISGLPFTSGTMAGGFSGQGLILSGFAGFSGLSDTVHGVVDEAATTARLLYGANNGTVLNDTNFTGTSGNYFSLTGCYVTT